MKKELSLKSTLALHAYSLLWLLLSPVIACYLLYRSLRQPAYRKHWFERFALKLPNFRQEPLDHLPDGPIWVHAVSLGETRAASSLLAAIARRYPKHRLLLTHGTPTGRQAGKDLLASLDLPQGQSLQLYLPYDNIWSVSRFFDQYQPKIGIMIETEVWPTLMSQVRKHDTRMMLVSARLSEKSLSKAFRSKILIKPALAAFDKILCQTDSDRVRIKTLVPDVVCRVVGNLKFDVALDESLLSMGKVWRMKADSDRGMPSESGSEAKPPRWVVAASTRDAEEALLIDQWLNLTTAEREDLVLVLVPRHPQRFDQVAQYLDRFCNSSWTRRSDPMFPAMNSRVQLVLGDSMGEMSAWYALADVVIMGGSLIDTGSQNLIEACSAGKPVVLGPSIYNFQQAAEQAIAEAAAIQTDSSQVLSIALELARDEQRCLSMGERAKHFVAVHQGATKRVVDAMSDLIKL